MKKYVAIFLALALVLTLAGCGQTGHSTSSESGNGGINLPAVENVSVNIDTTNMFTERDLKTDYDTEDCVTVTLTGNSAACDEKSVNISGQTVTITAEGTYLLSGTLNNGMILIDADKDDKIQLVLNGVNISNSTSAVLYVKQAEKVFITTAKNTENTLINGGSYAAIDDNNIDAVIYSKDDLTLNGEGTLTVIAKAGHGIVCKDDLKLTSGSYHITAASHGICGKDSVRIAGGTFMIAAGKDGIHAEHKEDENGGFLYIVDGSFQITAEGDGMSGSVYVLIENGSYNITAGGGSANGTKSNVPKDFDRNIAVSTEDDSTKGIKATGNLTIKNGEFNLNTADDALHSNGDVAISGGKFTIATGDDGIHADDAVAISGGTITILQSYEGIEGKTIDITGGDIDITASDDGLNAAGGNDSSGFGGRGGDMFASENGVYLNISGGKLHINASGDGIDSNGDLTVSGGEVYVSGPTNNGNGALDYNGNAVITGGILIAAGSTGMAQNFGSSSTQGCMLVNVSGNAGDTITLSDKSGKELVAWKADKAFGCVVISTPAIEKGATYTVSAGSNSTTVTMDSLLYGSFGGMGGGRPGGPGNGGGNRPGGMGGRP